MASRLGMTIRNERANARIDAALAQMAEGLDVPAAPDQPRDRLLAETLRLEWIADSLEAVVAGEDGGALIDRTRDELNELAAEAGVENPEKLKNKQEVVDAIEAAQAGEE